VPRSLLVAIALSTAIVGACGSAAKYEGSAIAPSATPTTAAAPETTATVAPTTTPSTVPRPTIADADRAMAQWAASREGIVEISIGNLRDGTVTDVTPRPQPQVRVASVIKVSIAISFLRVRHEQGRGPSAWELGALRDMIVESDNGDAYQLWIASGGPAAQLVTQNAAAITNTAYQAGHGWGFTLTTAHDQAKVETALARGRMLPAAQTQLVLVLMRSVVSSQRWGFADSVDPSLHPAIKNGWYEDTDEPVWRVHCTAIFDSPRLAHPFTVAVMTRYPAHLGIGYGQDTCRGVALLLGPRLTTRVEAVTHR
jgi:Beta-lactamase enzyme family